VAGRRLASPDDCAHWLPLWLQHEHDRIIGMYEYPSPSVIAAGRPARRPGLGPSRWRDRQRTGQITATKTPTTHLTRAFQAGQIRHLRSLRGVSYRRVIVQPNASRMAYNPIHEQETSLASSRTISGMGSTPRWGVCPFDHGWVNSLAHASQADCTHWRGGTRDRCIRLAERPRKGWPRTAGDAFKKQFHIPN
jgi:hypothetical protein